MAGENGVPEMLDFNPRSHEGSDGNVNKYIPFYWEFQSTLPRGERHYTPNSRTKSSDFNPRSHEGSDALTYTR